MQSYDVTVGLSSRRPAAPLLLKVAVYHIKDLRSLQNDDKPGPLVNLQITRVYLRDHKSFKGIRFRKF